MSSYFDYFCDKNKDSENNEMGSDHIKGTCLTMCPQEEVKLRENEKLVHILEVLGHERKLVKSYCRSAADSLMAVPRLLRPFPVLMQTVQYLLLKVTKRVDVPQSVVYDFVNDRLRAVRQDMTIQRLSSENCVQLLEPMVRFYVYYGYVLSQLPLKDFDPILNKKYLLECTKWCLNCYNTINKSDHDVIDRLTGFLNKLDVNRNSLTLVNDKILMEILYIVCNMDNVHPLQRYLDISKHNKRQPKLELAYELALANLQGNFIRVCRLMDKLCPLGYCAVYAYLPTLQRRALQVLSHAYHNKRLTVPSAVIAKWLRFHDRQEAETTCVHYGLKVEGGAVRFDKTEFKADAVLHQPRIPDLKTVFKLKDTIDIYTYTTN